eukprot:m.290778 g.290778  ORF g.290778 m.290778 type:complete len:53 (-) comp12359_c0_seq1:85-243(-)
MSSFPLLSWCFEFFLFGFDFIARAVSPRPSLLTTSPFSLFLCLLQPCFCAVL